MRDLLVAQPGNNLTEQLAASCFSRFDAIPPTGVLLASRQLIESRIGQPLDVIRKDLRAAIRLLDRLAARRYHRTVFRALPDMNVDGNRPRDVARRIGDPIVRSRIEREIEISADLPRGTVVMHCPPGDGPVKIAAMLLVMEEGGRAHQLRDIGELNESLFLQHQEAVLALEKMYKSMWRLEVAVAPPFRPEFERLELIIRQALYKELTGRHLVDHELPNDPLLRRELQEATLEFPDDDHEVVRVANHQGEETTIPLREFQVAQSAFKAVKNLPAVMRFLENEATFEGDVRTEVRSALLADLEEELEERVLNVAPQSSIVSEWTFDETGKFLTFSKWSKRVELRLSDSKTKGHFRRAKPEIKEILESLPDDVRRARFYSEFGTRLTNMGDKAVAANIDQHILVDAAKEIAEPLNEVARSWKSPDDLEPSPVWSGGERNPPRNHALSFGDRRRVDT